MGDDDPVCPDDGDGPHPRQPAGGRALLRLADRTGGAPLSMTRPGALFFYGTLRHRPLLDLVLGPAGAARVRLTPARLPGHAAHWVAGECFPMIRPRRRTWPRAFWPRDSCPRTSRGSSSTRAGISTGLPPSRWRRRGRCARAGVLSGGGGLGGGRRLRPGRLGGALGRDHDARGGGLHGGLRPLLGRGDGAAVSPAAGAGLVAASGGGASRRAGRCAGGAGAGERPPAAPPAAARRVLRARRGGAVASRLRGRAARRGARGLRGHRRGAGAAL
jgi:hypothetical protein